MPKVDDYISLNIRYSMQNVRHPVENAARPVGSALQTSPNFTTWTSRCTENQNEWKKHIEYGSRWQVEIFFSAFKRIFGSSVMAKTMDNIIQEIALKTALQSVRRYNSESQWHDESIAEMLHDQILYV